MTVLTVNELEFNSGPILGVILFLYMTYVTYSILFDKGNGKTVNTFYYLCILTTLIIFDVDLFFMMDDFNAVSEEYPIFYLIYPVLLGAHIYFVYKFVIFIQSVYLKKAD